MGLVEFDGNLRSHIRGNALPRLVSQRWVSPALGLWTAGRGGILEIWISCSFGYFCCPDFMSYLLYGSVSILDTWSHDPKVDLVREVDAPHTRNLTQSLGSFLFLGSQMKSRNAMINRLMSNVQGSKTLTFWVFKDRVFRCRKSGRSEGAQERAWRFVPKVPLRRNHSSQVAEVLFGGWWMICCLHDEYFYMLSLRTLDWIRFSGAPSQQVAGP